MLDSTPIFFSLISHLSSVSKQTRICNGLLKIIYMLSEHDFVLKKRKREIFSGL